jgi:hypothetical protein
MLNRILPSPPYSWLYIVFLVQYFYKKGEFIMKISKKVKIETQKEIAKSLKEAKEGKVVSFKKVVGREQKK